jgi:hypothetical protein
MSEPSQATAHGWCIADREVQKRVGPRVAGSPPPSTFVSRSLSCRCRISSPGPSPGCEAVDGYCPRAAVWNGRLLH